MPATFAIPLMTRNGGFLFAIPSGFLDENVLLDAFSAEAENDLGPSREFSSDLCEEDDDANPVFLGRKIEVLVVDLTDEALGDSSEYDPVTHDFSSCATFDADRPVALPLMTDILHEVRSWLQSATDDRSLFYSAQEDQEPAAPAKAATSKKPPPAKKVTNQAIMEHLAMLGSQMQALAAQQEELRSAAFKAPSATPVPGPAKLSRLLPKFQRCLPTFQPHQVLHQRLQSCWDLLPRPRHSLYLLPKKDRKVVVPQQTQLEKARSKPP